MRQYSSDLVAVSWSGVSLEEGLAEGSFLVIRRNRPAWSQRANGLGGTIRLYNPDRSGELDLLINTESQTHQRLLALAITDRLSRTVQGPIFVRDLNTGEAIVLTNAYITTEPDEQRATASVEVTWTFAFTSIEHAPNTSDRNVVGS